MSHSLSKMGNYCREAIYLESRRILDRVPRIVKVIFSRQLSRFRNYRPPVYDIWILQANIIEPIRRALVSYITSPFRLSPDDPRNVQFSNIGIAKAAYDAVYLGRPLIDTVVTVTGAKDEKNVLVRIGTPLRSVIENCGGYDGEPKKIVINGPMAGTAQHTDEMPVTKSTYGIFVQYDGMVGEIRPCIDCARCVDVCPKDLLPNLLAISADNSRFDVCLKYRIMDCIECGSCAHVCPSKIPIVQLIKYAKAEMEEQECN